MKKHPEQKLSASEPIGVIKPNVPKSKIVENPIEKIKENLNNIEKLSYKESFSNQPIELLLKRYQDSVKIHGREIRLSITEASELVNNISTLILKLNSLNDKVIDLQNNIIQEKNKQENTKISIKMDSGRF